MNISTPLRCLIKELGISQTEFAKKTGISQPHLHKLLNSFTSASEKTIEKINEAFNVELTVESKFVPKNKLTEFAVKMIDDTQPFRAMIFYLNQTFDCMIGMKDEFQDQVIDKEYLLHWMRFALNTIENQEE